MAAQPSLTRIVNRAAVHLGTARRVSSIDDGTPIASAARDVIDFVRDELLAEHPWNFAIKRAELAASATEAPIGWTFAYEAPSDMIRWLPWPQGEQLYFRAVQEGGFILSDAKAPLPFRYIARIEDPSLWSPGFIGALSASLAMAIAPTVTGSDTIDQKLTNRLLMAVKAGKRQDGLASGDRARNMGAGSGWLAARGNYGRDSQYGAPIVP